MPFVGTMESNRMVIIGWAQDLPGQNAVSISQVNGNGFISTRSPHFSHTISLSFKERMGQLLRALSDIFDVVMYSLINRNSEFLFPEIKCSAAYAYAMITGKVSSIALPSQLELNESALPAKPLLGLRYCQFLSEGN